jgi:hypothetical protein
VAGAGGGARTTIVTRGCRQHGDTAGDGHAAREPPMRSDQNPQWPLAVEKTQILRCLWLVWGSEMLEGVHVEVGEIWAMVIWGWGSTVD